ncbi:MAG TPA: NrfD/PsrC family molybdoenzyme membrane anchor subunit [Dehalococcoidales bacterium]|nr:NrfD/PsrC family molybdoenzyme membrane anchor subunit [Dehalococcoidales bacterium]
MQIKPWDFMVKYTPQREWIEGHGIMVAFAMFFGGISGGLYLSSLYFHSELGTLIAWVFSGLAGLTDMAHLSKPMRFWRMLRRPNSSWISRGFILIWLFLGAALIQMALTHWAPGNAWEIVFKVIGGVLAFGVAIYSGFALGFVGAIKFWNSGLVPILYVISGVTAGLAVVILVSLNATNLYVVGNYLVVALIAYAIAVATYFWTATYSSSAAKDSAVRVLKGPIAPAFWIGVVLLGIILPIAMVAPFSLKQNISQAVFIIASVFTVLGGIFLRYVILKAGMYTPLLPDSES